MTYRRKNSKTIFSLIVAFNFSVIPSGAIQISVNADGTPVAQGLQTLTMTNASPASSAASTGGATIVQYAQGPDGQQFYIPGLFIGCLNLN
jgi:hypothetical protein